MFLGSLALTGCGMVSSTGDASIKLAMQILGFFLIAFGVVYIVIGGISCIRGSPKTEAEDSRGPVNPTDLEKALPGPSEEEPAGAGAPATSATPAKPIFAYK